MKFDDVARLLAAGASRRRILSGLLGGSLGLAGLRDAGAKNACSEFCTELPPGERGRCRSDCAHGTGLFFQCEGIAARLCQQADGSFACCTATQQCIAGACQTPPPPGCASDDDCDDGNPCTQDVCDTATGACSNAPIANCCTADEQCRDNNACTTDQCVDNECENIPIAGCVPCASADDCVDDDICTEDACIDGRCVNTEIPDCDGCVCDGSGFGGACVTDADCCFGFCELGTCGSGEGCAGPGRFCGGAEFNNCCSGLCQNCRCVCIEDDQPCVEHRQCCGGVCDAGGRGCCRETGERCSSDTQCCSGHCIDQGFTDEAGEPVFACEQGGTGTPCASDGDCIGACDESGTCTCADSWCWVQADCCPGFACVADSGAAPFTGTCLPSAGASA